MLQLLSCSKGHSWEAAADDGAVGRAVCPVCGEAVDLLPLFDLAPSADAITTSPEPILPQAPPLRDAAGKPVVAGFEIQEEVGRSSLGVRLFKAKQVLVNRPVLLKVVVARDDAGQLGWGALRGEAAALGRLSHPNIIPIFEVGERERQLFYNAVEWVDGPTLAQHAAGKPLPPRQAAQLVEVLARAVHTAHEQGVVHRGLRPACIRLQPLPEGVLPTPASPGRGGRVGPVEPPFYLLGGRSRCLPRIGDFGLARRPVEGDAADVELYEDSPSGLSPEQAWGRTREIGPSCDIYALGTILYELLSGRPPFRGRTAGETLDFIRSGDPPMLYGRVPGLSNDLAVVCRKAMQRNPRNRYQTALEFADDLRAFAARRPVKAWKAGVGSRLILWIRRRPLAALLLLVCLLAPVGALIAHSFGAGDAAAAKAELDKANSRADSAEYLRQNAQSAIADAKKKQDHAAYSLGIFLADREFQAGNTIRERQLLKDCPADLRHWEWHYLTSRLAAAEFLSLTGPEQAVTALAYSPDGRLLAAASGAAKVNDDDPPAKWEVHVWQPQSPGNDHVLTGFREQVRQIAFSPDGKRLATASSALNDFGAQVGEVKEWDPTQARALATWTINNATPMDLAYSADGKRLTAVDDRGRVHAFLVGAKGELPVVVSQAGAAAPHLALLNAEGTRVAATISGNNDVRIYDMQRGGAGTRVAMHQGDITALTFNPEMNLLASADNGGVVFVWDVQNNRQTATIQGHNGAVTGLSFSRDGRRLATSGEDGDVRIWDPATGEEMLKLTPFEKTAVKAVQFNPGKDNWQLAAAHGTEVRVFGQPHP